MLNFMQHVQTTFISHQNVVFRDKVRIFGKVSVLAGFVVVVVVVVTFNMLFVVLVVAFVETV